MRPIVWAVDIFVPRRNLAGDGIIRQFFSRFFDRARDYDPQVKKKKKRRQEEKKRNEAIPRTVFDNKTETERGDREDESGWRLLKHVRKNARFNDYRKVRLD